MPEHFGPGLGCNEEECTVRRTTGEDIRTNLYSLTGVDYAVARRELHNDTRDIGEPELTLSGARAELQCDCTEVARSVSGIPTVVGI